MAVFSVNKLRGPRRPVDDIELIALAKPRLGDSLALYRSDTGRRIFTTPVMRILASEGGTHYVQTKNSLYRFETMERAPFQLPRAGHAW